MATSSRERIECDMREEETQAPSIGGFIINPIWAVACKKCDANEQFAYTDEVWDWVSNHKEECPND